MSLNTNQIGIDTIMIFKAVNIERIEGTHTIIYLNYTWSLAMVNFIIISFYLAALLHNFTLKHIV